jgi:hypothetical protein
MAGDTASAPTPNAQIAIVVILLLITSSPLVSQFSGSAYQRIIHFMARFIVSPDAAAAGTRVTPVLMIFSNTPSFQQPRLLAGQRQCASARPRVRLRADGRCDQPTDNVIPQETSTPSILPKSRR